MSKTSLQQSSDNFDTIFAQLNEQDVEEFYRGYQYWNVQHQIEMLHICLSDVRKQISENTERIQEAQPTAIELATLARLQSNGVSDIDLLDRMLERGEMWLDRTMQRLDYLEQLDDFISDDYTQWCQHALEGAYDWIDSVLDSSAISKLTTANALTTTEEVQEEQLIEATEELFLQKISTDEEESFAQEITLKRPSISTADLEEVVQPSEDSHAEDEDTTAHENSIAILEEANPLDNTEDTRDSNSEEDAHTEFTASDELLSVDSSSTSGSENLSKQELVEVFAASEESPSTPLHALQQSEEQPSSEVTSSDSKEIEAHFSSNIPEVRVKHQKNQTPRRPNVFRRFIGRIWGSQA